MRALGSGSLAVRREIPRAILSNARPGPTPSRDRARMADVEIPDAGPVTRHPCGIDPESPAHWPWNVPAVRYPTRVEPVVVVEADAEADVDTDADVEPARSLPTGRIDDVVVFCTALDCTDAAAQVRKNTEPEFSDLCERHRRSARQRVSEGKVASVVAYRLRMGVGPGRPRSAA